MAAETRWLTPKEAAAYCRVDEVTLRRAVQRKLLCAFRVNGGKRVRYRVADLDAWLCASPAQGVRS